MYEVAQIRDLPSSRLQIPAWTSVKISSKSTWPSTLHKDFKKGPEPRDRLRPLVGSVSMSCIG